jgi:FkbM family methyltransferase
MSDDTSGDTTGIALARYELRRVVQTRRAFVNWPVLLRQMAAEKLGRKGGTLEFVTRAGVRLSAPNVPGARLPLYEQYADDSYRLGEVLAPFRGRPLQVLDVGAHIGAFALNVMATHPDARIDCYEPSPQSAAYLRRNVEANGFDGRVTVHEAALADSEGTAQLDDNDSASVHNGLIRSDGRMVEGHDALASRHAIEVPTTTFDKAVAAAAAPPQLVKMDCEGGEYPLVYASSPESWAAVERVVMEYHPVAGESWPQLRSWLADVGLHVVRERSERPGLGTAWLARSGK